MYDCAAIMITRCTDREPSFLMRKVGQTHAEVFAKFDLMKYFWALPEVPIDVAELINFRNATWSMNRYHYDDGRTMRPIDTKKPGDPTQPICTELQIQESMRKWELVAGPRRLSDSPRLTRSLRNQSNITSSSADVDNVQSANGTSYRTELVEAKKKLEEVKKKLDQQQQKTSQFGDRAKRSADQLKRAQQQLADLKQNTQSENQKLKEKDIELKSLKAKLRNLQSVACSEPETFETSSVQPRNSARIPAGMI